MDRFIASVLQRFREEGDLMASIFPPEQETLLRYARQTANEIVSVVESQYDLMGSNSTRFHATYRLRTTLYPFWTSHSLTPGIFICGAVLLLLLNVCVWQRRRSRLLPPKASRLRRPFLTTLLHNLLTSLATGIDASIRSMALPNSTPQSIKSGTAP